MSVSVIIPTYNRVDLLEKLLISIVNQSHAVNEVLIVNDNSTCPYEYEITVSKYRELLNIKYIYLNVSKGAQYCRNLGLNIATTDWVCFVDDDDYWGRDKIKNQLKIANKNKKAGLIYSWAYIVNESEEKIGEYRYVVGKNSRKEILDSCFIPSPTVMVKREDLIALGGFDEGLVSCQDWDTWIRLIFSGVEVYVSQSYDAYYLKHSRSSIGTSSKALHGYSRVYKKNLLKFCHNYKFLLSVIKFFVKHPKLLIS